MTTSPAQRRFSRRLVAACTTVPGTTVHQPTLTSLAVTAVTAVTAITAIATGVVVIKDPTVPNALIVTRTSCALVLSLVALEVGRRRHPTVVRVHRAHQRRGRWSPGHLTGRWRRHT